MKKKDKEFKIRSDAELKKEVQEDLNKFLKDIPKEKNNKKKPIKKIDKPKKVFNTEDEMLKEYLRVISEERVKLNEKSDSEIADWLIETHNNYVNTINELAKTDFLNPQSPEDRYQIVFYVYSLWLYLESRELEKFSEEVVRILNEKGYSKLINILDVLGYI